MHVAILRLGIPLIAVGTVSLCSAQEAKVVCGTCHVTQAGELSGSTHAALTCQECHAGEASYTMRGEDIARFKPGGSGGAFDHGEAFKGKPDRASNPDLCGSCHADVERMNPFGLRTDQLARYWTSGHGKTLRDTGDDRVAVCIDCHGVHDVLAAGDPLSTVHPTAVPDTCAACHADESLMTDYDLAVEIVDEYRRSVHGTLLLERGDTGAPTCASCHGNHSAMPPGFATIGAVCGRCHEHVAVEFEKSVHSRHEEHMGCVQCHGGGQGSHFHLIEKITKPPGALIARYQHLLATEPSPAPEEVTETIHPGPRQIIERALPTCLDCHEDLEDDESLPKMFEILDRIAAAERRYVMTAQRLDEIGRGVLLVDSQRFKFQDAKTSLIELAPIQHTLDNGVVGAKVVELNVVCDEVNAELDELELGLARRRGALLPVWAFSLFFAGACYAKYKQLKAVHVKPLPAKWDRDA